jgi:ABC-type arginine/histidine transport system permease subunit
MKEFWLWVIIVSLIIACILALFLLMAHMNKETRRMEMMIQRIEEMDKKRKETKDE